MTKRRSLTAKKRLELFTLHGGVCHFCDGKIDGTRERWEVSHEIPLELGGADDDQNRKPAHFRCHRDHTAKVDIPVIAKAKRTHERHVGARRGGKHKLPGGRDSKWKKKLDGTVVPR